MRCLTTIGGRKLGHLRPDRMEDILNETTWNGWDQNFKLNTRVFKKKKGKNYNLPYKINSIFRFEHQSFNFCNLSLQSFNFFNSTNIILKFSYCPYFLFFINKKKTKF
jgi:hypothetical protein